MVAKCNLHETIHYTFGLLKIQMPETRKRTNAEIDLLNQFLKEGETPLPYEIDVENSDIQKIELSPEAKAEQEQLLLAEAKRKEEEEIEAAKKQKELDDIAEAEKQKIIAQEAEKNKTAPNTEIKPTIVEAELDDEKVLAYLKNKKGKEVTSLDEFLNPKAPLTEEEKRAIAEKRDGDKIAFGLSKGLFTKKQLEEFITDTKNPKELVYAHFVTEQKEKDDTLTDIEIEEEFKEKFGLDAKEDSRQFKVGQNLLNNIADNIVRKKHGKILNLENDFSSYETAQATQQQHEAKVLNAAPLYKKDVEEIRSEIKKVSIPVSDTENFEVDVDDEIVDGIIASMLDKKHAEPNIANGWDKETLKQGAHITAIIKSLPKMLTKYADAQVLAKQAGVRGVIPNQDKRGQRTQENELTERQKAMQNHFFSETIAN